MSNSSVRIHTNINAAHNRYYFSSKDKVKRYEKKCYGSKNGDLSDWHGELNERYGVLKFKSIRAESRRHGGGREGSSFPVKTPRMFYDPSLFSLLVA